MKKNKHCCEQMEIVIKLNCKQHRDEYECPDALIKYHEKFDEYGIIIHDGGTAISTINYCPYCGYHLPQSKRDRWFNELEVMGYDNPSEQDIPDNYKSGEWYGK